MRVLELSWEYPPRLYGGLGRHVDALAAALARAGHQVTVVALGHTDAPAEEARHGVRVLRADPPPVADPEGDWLAEVLAANVALTAVAARLLRTTAVDVCHAHDWLVAHAATALARAFDLPLVATVHATERGRHQGFLPTALSRAIDRVERWLATEAVELITCSTAMREAVEEAFDLPGGTATVIPNGVDAAEAAAVPALHVARMRARLTGPGEQLIAFAGRLEYEKGVHTLLRAVRRLQRLGRRVRLAVAGDGTYAPHLHDLAARLRLGGTARFLGFLDRRELATLLRAADVVAVPSIYEPFGLAALEAMAAGTPLVAARAGGLAEVVDDGRTGLLHAPGDVGSLTAALGRTLAGPVAARRRARAARAAVAPYDWDAVAARTAAVYGRAASGPGPAVAPGRPAPARVPLRPGAGRPAAH